jgi:hypothetical protein
MSTKTAPKKKAATPAKKTVKAKATPEPELVYDSGVSINVIREMRKEHVLEFELESTAPYMCNQFSNKAKEQMLFAMMNPTKQGRATGKARPPKDPFQDFFEAGYWNFEKKGKSFVPANLCMKVMSIKNAIIAAAGYLGDRRTLTMKDCKRAIKVHAPLLIKKQGFLPLDGTGPLPEDQKDRLDVDPRFSKKLAPYHEIGVSLDEELVKVGQGTSDLRYRPVLWSWTATLVVRFSRYSPDLMAEIVAEAGEGGIGEYRPTSPQSTGPNGTFAIKNWAG